MNRTQGDAIDRALRSQQEGQTIGIPIGPDCSLVVAELILSAIDIALNPRNPRGFRHIDDYEIGFKTLAEAESTLTELQGLLAHYELNLNPRKTGIVEGPPSLDEHWAIELGRFPFKGTTTLAQLNEAVAFFSRAFDLSREHPQQAVLRYAVVTAQRWMFVADGWWTFQGLLFNAATADPLVLPVVIVLLQRHIGAGCTINRTLAERVIESIITRHAPLGHGSEVAWALWTAIQFGIDLSATTASVIGSFEDDVVALLALDANAQGRFPQNSLDTTNWQRLVTLPGSLHSEHWLLAYEANHHGWIACPHVATHPFFRVLEQNNVAFYEGQRRLLGFTGPAAAVPGGVLPLGYA